MIKRVRVRRPEVEQRKRRTVIDKQRAKYLLHPIAAFLESGGLTKDETLRCWPQRLMQLPRERGAWSTLATPSNTPT